MCVIDFYKIQTQSIILLRNS